MFKRMFRNTDKPLLVATLLLTVVGVMVLYATTVKAAGVTTDVDARNQLIFAIVGLTGLTAVTIIDYRLWMRLTGVLYC